MAKSIVLSEQEADQATIKWYKSAIGPLIWPAIYTQADIPYLVEVLSWYYANLSLIHSNLVSQIFQ